MAILKEITLNNDVKVNYIRIEFLYAYNNRNSKTIFCRVGLYVSQNSKEPVSVEEYNYTWEELGYTGNEELFSLVYTKLKQKYTGAIDII